MTEPINPSDVLKYGPYQVPVGTIMPFQDSLPDNWLVWNGELIDSDRCPELIFVLNEAWPFIQPIWEYFGGVKIDDTAYLLPDMLSEDVWKQMGIGHNPYPIVMAQKARSDRDPNSQDGTASQIRLDDPAQG